MRNTFFASSVVCHLISMCIFLCHIPKFLANLISYNLHFHRFTIFDFATQLTVQLYETTKSILLSKISCLLIFMHLHRWNVIKVQAMVFVFQISLLPENVANNNYECTLKMKIMILVHEIRTVETSCNVFAGQRSRGQRNATFKSRLFQSYSTQLHYTHAACYSIWITLWNKVYTQFWSANNIVLLGWMSMCNVSNEHSMLWIVYIFNSSMWHDIRPNVLV